MHADSDNLPNASVLSPCQYHDKASFNSLSAKLNWPGISILRANVRSLKKNLEPFAHLDTQYAAGGVAIYTKDNISYVVRHDLSEILTEAESLWLEVMLNGKKTVISVIYRYPAP